MRLWHRLTFAQRTIVVFFGFFFLATLNMLVVYFLQSDNFDNARRQSIVQEEKIKTHQKIASLLEANSIDEELQLNVSRQLKLYDQLIAKTVSGGYLSSFKIEFPEPEDEGLLILNEVSHLWDDIWKSTEILLHAPTHIDTIVQRVEEVRIADTLDIFTSRVISDIESIPNPEYELARQNLTTLLPEWSAASQQYLQYLITSSAKEHKLMVNVSLIFWVIISVLLLILFFQLKQKFYKPLRHILASGEKVSQGNYTVKVNEGYEHELGEISNIFNRTATTLKSATDIIRAFGDGKVNENITLTEDQTSQDTIKGALLKMQQQMQQLEQEDKEREWISEGVAQFADLLRSSNESIKKLSDKITSALVKYTSSLVGGTYLLNEEGELELMAFYAFDTKKYNIKKYKPGEGLVGQTFLEEDFIYLLEIPEDYISVTTGIGETSPKAILLVPLKVEKDVFGVIELASMREYKDYEIDFVRKVSESIAATIQNVKINQQTKQLLEESQNMTEQMRSQEEEMRQNMEELSATQEEMGRKEQEMMARLTAINNTLCLAEYDMSKKIVHVNKNFALIHGYPDAELVGLSFTKLLPDGEAASNEMKMVWRVLEEGEVFKGTFQRKTREGQIIEIQATLTPIQGAKGDIYKIIELAEPVNTSSKGSTKELSDVEEALKQHLEGIDITQKKLDEQLEKLKQKIGVFDEKVLMLETDKIGSIKNKDQLFRYFNQSFTSVYEILNEKIDIFISEESTGDIDINNVRYRYLMKQVNENSYFFMFVKI